MIEVAAVLAAVVEAWEPKLAWAVRKLWIAEVSSSALSCPSPLLSSLAKAVARLVSVELDEALELLKLDEPPSRAVVTSDRLKEPSPLVSRALTNWPARSEADAGAGGGGGPALCSAEVSSLELISPSPLVSSLANSVAMVELSVELVELLDVEASRALVSSDRLREPSPSVSSELISWLAASANSEAEVELELVDEDELESLS
jgi:hypothetical protein